MKRLLLINENCGIGSHGKICTKIADEWEKNGYEVRIAYGRHSKVPDEAKKYAYKIGNKLVLIWHILLTRIFDLHGRGSYFSTKKFIKWVDEFKPDVVWLHNIHGYFINYKLLFNYLKNNQKINIKWTLHDCWSFTGHCSHFSFSKCEKWKKGCHNCPEKRNYPKSIFLDLSKLNYVVKKKYFTSLDNIEIITPCNWLKEIVGQSFLEKYSCSVERNTIDKKIFYKQESDFRKKHNIENKIVLLFVANVWTVRKGLTDMKKLFGLLNETYVAVVVGLDKKQAKTMPANVISISRTNNQQELAKIYSASNVLINLSYEDTFPTVNLESEACGTPVYCYDTCGCKETLSNHKSKIFPVGKLSDVYNAILEMKSL